MSVGYTLPKYEVWSTSEISKRQGCMVGGCAYNTMVEAIHSL